MSADRSFAGARWDGEAPSGHTESWFLKANEPSGDRAIWLKWTLFQSARSAGSVRSSSAIAETWAVAFVRGGPHTAVKSSSPATSARFSREELDLAIDESTLNVRAARGSVTSGGRAVAFDLAIAPRGEHFHSFPAAWMRRSFPTQKVASPIVDARVSGTVRVDGEPWHLHAWPGMVGHNWGPRHSPAYAWIHCNAFAGGRELVVECASGRARVGPVLAPFATVAWARLDGADLFMNGVASILRNRATVSPHRYTFRAQGGGATLEGEIEGDPADTVGLLYPNPDGAPTHCLNTKLARATFELRTPRGEVVRVTSRAAALEVGTLDPSHGVRIYV